jgi:thiol-disulfide isomerase/thioredoxin
MRGALVKPIWTPLLIAVVLGLGPVAAPAAATWNENIGLLVQVDGKPSGAAHLYDSEDYQQMLLCIEGQPKVAILDLATAIVTTAPAESLRVGTDGIAEFEEAGSEYLSPLEQNEGTLSFAWDASKLLLTPLPPLVGPAELAHVLELKPAYAHDAAAYKPEAAKLGVLKAVATDTEMRVYFGTWCHLCKRLLPGLIRSIELAANPKLHVSYIGVAEDMREPEAELSRDAISKTPTIVVLQGGREIGRIEEEVPTTVEAALAGIVGGGK